MTHTFPTNFSTSVQQLITLGEKNTRSLEPWEDYQDIGITSEHIPELVRILQEIEQFWPIGDTESAEVSAPIHAWRALGQLRAAEAVPALIDLVIQNEELESDWIMEEIPEVMARIGPVCIPSLRAYLQNPLKKTWAAVTVSHCLEEVAKQNPDSRSDCVAALTAGLEDYLSNDETVNGFLISYLANLKAAEAAPLVKLAYRADRVDLSILGDFEEFRISVGLLEKRLTPPPRYGWFQQPELQWEEDKKKPPGRRTAKAGTGSKREKETQAGQENPPRQKRKTHMTTESATIVQRLWNYCNVLRDDGVSYGDYVEQLTYLLFLKMADEQTRPPFRKPAIIPEAFAWPSLLARDGGDLETHYRQALVELGTSKGMLGVIFRKAQNRIQDPAKLKRLIALIDEETWMGLDIDIKGEIYEGLLQKNAEDTKSGAGQYFTPRPLIKAMVEVMRPAPGMTICDPACGTGGFFLAAHDYLVANHDLDRDQKQALRYQTFRGWEIVDNTARLCVMNLYLHGIGGATAGNGDGSPVEVNDSLISDPGDRFDLVLTNPPFGKKSSITIVNPEGKADRTALTYERDDFWATTSNKQLNFVQHIATLLKINGRAAVVIPDNVLFEGGAGETVRRRLLQGFDVHTLLRLPTGIFYAQGVKANVLFFEKKPGSERAWTDRVWIYDLRTNLHFTLKTNPMRYEDLQDFIRCYNPQNRHARQETDRFRSFSYDEILQRDKVSLDIFWLKDESLEDTENLPDPDVLAAEIVENLESALMQFESILEELG